MMASNNQKPFNGFTRRKIIKTFKPPLPRGVVHTPVVNKKINYHSFFFFVFAQYQKHLFVHIGGPVSYSDPLLEVSATRSHLQICGVLDYRLL